MLSDGLDTPDRRRFIEPVEFTNDRLTFLNATGEAYLITDDAGNAHGIYLDYADAVRELATFTEG